MSGLGGSADADLLVRESAARPIPHPPPGRRADAHWWRRQSDLPDGQGRRVL